MTDDMMSLRALLEKSPDADLLRFAAHRLPEAFAPAVLTANQIRT